MDCSRNSGRAARKGLVPVPDARFWGLDVHATRHVRFFPPSLLRAQLRTKVDAYYRWPTPSSMPVAECKQFEDALPQGHFHRLPLEILLDIVVDCPVSTVVNLSTTCHFIGNFLMDTQVLNAILRSAVLSPTGSLRLIAMYRHKRSY